MGRTVTTGRAKIIRFVCLVSTGHVEKYGKIKQSWKESSSDGINSVNQQFGNPVVSHSRSPQKYGRNGWNFHRLSIGQVAKAQLVESTGKVSEVPGVALELMANAKRLRSTHGKMMKNDEKWCKHVRRAPFFWWKQGSCCWTVQHGPRKMLLFLPRHLKAWSGYPEESKALDCGSDSLFQLTHLGWWVGHLESSGIIWHP